MNHPETHVTVLDATLRDGGYANDYGFTPDDVSRLTEGLGAAGVPMIEIGHGYGLGGERSMGPMSASVEEYLDAACRRSSSKVGMFANAGITADDDLVRAKTHGLDFVRIGCIGFDGPHPFDEALRLADRAKELGLWVSVNLVRTQFLDAKELATVASSCEAHGLDAVYVVDSPGGALPEEVERMVAALRNAGDVAVGFHGHQNLDLAIANSLAAVRAGATFVDGTLTGIGRDSGNAQLDVLVSVLAKAGYATSVSVEALAPLSEILWEVVPTHVGGIRPENLVLGRFDLLSHGLAVAKAVAERHHVDLSEVLERMRAARLRFEGEADVEELLR